MVGMGRRYGAALIGALGVAAFAALRMLPMIGANIGFGLDTARYEAVARMSVLSKEFLAGAAPPVYPLYLKLLQYNSTAATIGEAVAGVAAWTFLAWMAARVPQDRAIRF